MGIRIQRNTWSAPLQLIDSWLPQPPATSARHKLTSVAQRFTRAGWLGRSAAIADAPEASTTCRTAPPGPQPCAHRTAAVRIVRATNGQGDGARGDTRVVLSGSIADVCAELERLAAQEPGLSAVHH
ncbi:hypothetical protein [Hydrogenophaga sp.]|uniref:hypothetical protein n=1 Tax=Hydrogenophaga sp. TaxID=1904254 RepID=UPI00286E7838|nr:hypothetical protein [Hydrogenophaga sp.]